LIVLKTEKDGRKGCFQIAITRHLFHSNQYCISAAMGMEESSRRVIDFQTKRAMVQHFFLVKEVVNVYAQ